MAKLQASWCVLLFLSRACDAHEKIGVGFGGVVDCFGLGRRALQSFDLIRGRGVVIESIAADSPLNQVGSNRRRSGRSIAGECLPDIDEALAQIAPNTTVSAGIISQGEQVERSFTLTVCFGLWEASAIIGFVASGWTRHYVTFAELMQMIALLALGLALAHLRNHGPNMIFKLAIVAAGLLTAGLVFTAMRTVIVAFVIGASVMALRSLRGR